VRRDVQALRLQAPGFALHLSPARLHIAKSGQFICYKTGQVYLLLTGKMRAQTLDLPFEKQSTRAFCPSQSGTIPDAKPKNPNNLLIFIIYV
jgi:hypothetical protein